MPGKSAPLNTIWLFLILAATVVAAFQGTMAQVTKASFDSAKDAVTLAISLVGAMALWLGIMRVAEDAGLMRAVARTIRPLMVRLFPDVPAEHPAMSAMIMNMAANMLGLGNAATPMGIKAMTELDRLNPRKGTATNAMCLFLAINTSSVTILPLGVIAVRAAAGAARPADILVTTLVATVCSTVTAVLAAKAFARRESRLIPESAEADGDRYEPMPTPARQSQRRPGALVQAVVWGMAGLYFGAIVYRFISGDHLRMFTISFVSAASNWLIPTLMCTLLLAGWFRGVHVYESIVEGAKEGFNTAVRIIPFMVAIFVAIGMFRASGAMELLSAALAPVLRPFGFPTEALTVALLRPLSGSGSFAAMSEIVKQAPDSFAAYLASTIQGSTETTFYVLAVYFGAVGIQRTRYALPVGLIADAAGIVGALVICRLIFRAG